MSLRLKETISCNVSGNSGTATTLQTARTINGTSFNGSTDITTDKWGAQRTITVGKSGKSVNGSTNVSWTVDEIGAVEGQKVSAATAATAQWYRIAQTTSTNQDNTLGLFHITAACNSRHSTTFLNAGITFGQNPTLVQLSHTQYNTTGLSKARIVYHTTYSGNRAYLEVYVPDAAARTISVQLFGNTGWSLVTPSTVGSIPSGYTNTEISLASNRIVGQLNGNASTATTLQTARTINGTSFNGSANITTANWGTSRNITIGNNTKPVNGSGNVAWTLAEIGAVPVSSNSSITVHADADSSSASEYLLLKAGHNELKIASSAGGTTSTKGSDKITFNGYQVYHAGKKPTASEIGAAAASHTHSYLPLSGGSMTGAIQMNGQQIKLTTANSGYARIGYESSTNDVYISNYNNNWLRIKSDATMTIGGHKIYAANNKPSPADIGAATTTHNHGLLHDTLGSTIPNTTTDSGWSMINNTYNGYILKSLRTQASAPNWLCNDYSAGIAFGGADTKGVMSMKYNRPSIKFAGGNGSKPTWWLEIYGTSGKSYNLDSYLPLSGGNLTGNLLTSSNVEIGSYNSRFGAGYFDLLYCTDDIYASYIETSTIQGISEYNNSNYGTSRALHLDISTGNGGLIVTDRYVLPAYSNTSLGGKYNTFYSIFLTNSPHVGSDRRLKNNIKYIHDDKDVMPLSLNDNEVEELTLSDFYDFIKNDLKLTSFYYKKDDNANSYDPENFNFGFIAQDIMDTKIGQKIVTGDLSNEEDILSYNIGSYISVVAAGLQQTIKKCEGLEEIVETQNNTINTLEKRLAKLEELIEKMVS